MTQTNTPSWAKAHVIRSAELTPLRSNPPDVLLPRYKRDRFSVIGRADERTAGEAGVAVDAKINFGYIRCASGTGNCSHKHPNWEIFIPMSGRWRMVMQEGLLDEPGELTLEPWDVIVIPGDTFHQATNISNDIAWLLSLNPGRKGAPYTLHPDVVEELRRLSPEAAQAAEQAMNITLQR